MSVLTYTLHSHAVDKPLVCLRAEVRTPPFSSAARIDADAIVIGGVFARKTAQTPRQVIENCLARFRAYDQLNRG